MQLAVFQDNVDGSSEWKTVYRAGWLRWDAEASKLVSDNAPRSDACELDFGETRANGGSLQQAEAELLHDLPEAKKFAAAQRITSFVVSLPVGCSDATVAALGAGLPGAAFRYRALKN